MNGANGLPNPIGPQETLRNCAAIKRTFGRTESKHLASSVGREHLNPRTLVSLPGLLTSSPPCWISRASITSPGIIWTEPVSFPSWRMIRPDKGNGWRLPIDTRLPPIKPFIFGIEEAQGIPFRITIEKRSALKTRRWSASTTVSNYSKGPSRRATSTTSSAPCRKGMNMGMC